MASFGKVSAAIAALQGGDTGKPVSRQAIKAALGSGVTAARLNNTLKSNVASGKLVQIKASYRLKIQPGRKPKAAPARRAEAEAAPAATAATAAGAAEAAAGAICADGVRSMKVSELRCLLAARGIGTAGRKSELQEKLLQHLAAPAASSLPPDPHVAPAAPSLLPMYPDVLPASANVAKAAPGPGALARVPPPAPPILAGVAFPATRPIPNARNPLPAKQEVPGQTPAPPDCAMSTAADVDGSGAATPSPARTPVQRDIEAAFAASPDAVYTRDELNKRLRGGFSKAVVTRAITALLRDETQVDTTGTFIQPARAATVLTVLRAQSRDPPARPPPAHSRA